MDLMTQAIDFREYRGNKHFMQQLQREYQFPIQVFQEDENGRRTLLRVESPSL